MNLTKISTTTILSILLAFPATSVLSQEKEETVNQNLNQAEQNIDNVGENLKDAGKALGNSVGNTGEAAEQGLENTGEAIGEGLEDAGNAIERNYNQAEEEVAETAAAIEQRSNWGWLGLLGLLGLFGLVGKNKKEVVVDNRGIDPLERNDRTTVRTR